MEYGVQPAYPYSPHRLSGYSEAFVPNAQATHDPSSWMTTLCCLRNQKGYLEDLLSKTATTLNALRDRQTRNERALSANPTPRSKKKKILQNRWRTDKTIKTCENEERVILDCLHVCQNNIYTLESLLCPPGLSLGTAEWNSSVCPSYIDTDSTATDFDWNGWADDGATSPFRRSCQRPVIFDEIPPEACWDEAGLGKLVTTGRRPPPLPPHSHPPSRASATPPPPPPNTALTHTALSPAAASSAPSVSHELTRIEDDPTLDKLSISGLLASKHVQMIQKKRFADAATGHIFQRLSSNANTRPSVAPSRQHLSWSPETRPAKSQRERGLSL